MVKERITTINPYFNNISKKSTLMINTKKHVILSANTMIL